MNFKYVGKSLPGKDAVQKVTGRLVYTGDLRLPNMLYAKLLLSSVANGVIKAIDTEAALAIPGVIGVYTHADIPKVPYNSYIWHYGQEEIKDEYMLSDRARFVGDRIAVVVAEKQDIAAKAAKLIRVDYEQFPAVTTPLAALAQGAHAVHPGGNHLGETEFSIGRPEEVWSEGYVTVTDVITTPRTHHAAMETHVCTAAYGADGLLTIWSPCQGVYGVRSNVAEVLSMPLNKIRVIKTPVGGSFGGKQETLLEPLTAFLALVTGHPVRLTMDRRETMLATRTRTATSTCIKSAVSTEGLIRGREVEMIIDAGAYCSNSRMINKSMGKKHFRLYRIPHMSYKGRSVYTNTPVAGGHRAWGSPQVCAAGEIHMDHIAGELNMDPVELRLKNLVKPFDIDPISRRSLGNARVIDCLVKGAKEFKWYEKREQYPSSGHLRRGVGVACGCHPISYYGVHHDLTTMTLKMHEDGSLTLNTGIHDVGCGVVTTLAQIVAEVLELDPEAINVLEADTERGHYDIGTYASRNLYMGGTCAV